ncbi:MAG: hypothetical protein HOV81_23995 [Kofleriaceae bacterium]|nr:hypothetical protein [Kofleriaceae bacterium]
MQEEQLARLRDAFSHHAVSAWLGYGDVLFLGFGERVLPRVQAGERHARPPYELTSNFASWRVEGPVAAQWTDEGSPTERAELTAAAESLIGERVEAWVLLDQLGLRLVFTGSKVLIVEPWPTSDDIADAWSLTGPDERILAVSNDGRSIIVQAETPVRDWFPDAPDRGTS